ncbi:replication protein RepA [Azoarcus olearius]|uniref:Probable replicase protein(RepA) n=1 Tax=Azoarcus sp. (strain BH72) TaxID=418699 RepID=A1K752_AZOSB|nr:probable replicase protein(repA) [Azoarcus olearius]
MPTSKPTQLKLDYRSGQPIPAWVREVIDAHLAIETEDARSAGALGFMARALVIATMPYKDPKTDVFKRQNGDFRLRIIAGYEGGIPYGIYPRLLMSWVSTEAVRTRSPVIQLGDSLRAFLRDVMDLRSTGGGVRGSGTRVA